MTVSYSFHLSSKSHAVTNINKINQVGKHNLREYKSDTYNRDEIKQLVGSESMLQDVKAVYHREFDDAVEYYNSLQKRSDRQINDYLEHVSESRADAAAEIIVQIGDQEFWKDCSKEAMQQAMTPIFKDQLTALSQYCPDFKVANAVIHYDEKSPHMHVVGVPVGHGYERGMECQVAKTKVFTKASLEFLQDKMRERAEIGMRMNEEVFKDVELKEKEIGRNKDIPKRSLDEYYKIENDKKLAVKDLDNIKEQHSELAFENFTAKMSLKKLQNEKAAAEKQSKKLDIEIADKTSKNAELDALNTQMTNNMIETQKRLDDAHASLDEVQTQRNQISFDNAVLMLDKDELTKQIDELSQQSKELDTEIGDMKSQKTHLERERTEMINSIAKTEKCLDEAYTALNDVSAKNEALISKHDELLQQNEELDQRNKSERKKQQQLSDENKKYVEYVKNNKTRAESIKATIEVRAAQLKELNDKYNEAVKVVEKHDKLKNEIQDLQAELGITKKSQNQEIEYQKVPFSSDKVIVDKTVLEYAKIGKEIKEQSKKLVKKENDVRSRGEEIIKDAEAQASEIVKDANDVIRRLNAAKEESAAQKELSRYKRAFSEKELEQREDKLGITKNRSKEHINERER